MKMKDAGTQSYIWSGFGAFFALLSLQEWLAVISLTVGVITMLVNSYYKKKENERKNAERARLEELHKLRVERMQLKIKKEKELIK
ncbi:HP1 family phage holin [Pasteurella multocida]|uniref:HP1 family phage holin n=1 Tax=Pasteurella multocida TaxID=747 RepID=UPI0009D6E6FA|nr:holin [Pasteurella multocida]UBU74804.1 phage holin family protein [Pasteurella multocida]UOP50827.1 phage holin family protein [Pasteurella multocida]UOP51911.1 phage holin family protein [Pasteurella multocida]UOP52273.1 phage holin family protein [Pasteurella multocida]UZT13515.1 holin [Pasteurella multocida]